MELKIGDRAKLSGLKGQPLLNGHEVELRSWLEEKGRWECALPDGKKINVFPANMLRLASAPLKEKDTARRVLRSSSKGIPSDVPPKPVRSPPGAESARPSKAQPRSPRAQPEAPSVLQMLGRRPKVPRQTEPVLVVDDEMEEAKAKPAPKAQKQPKQQSPPKQEQPKQEELEKPQKRTRLEKKNGERSVEEIYQKKTQQEHILLRPDSYVGSVERQRQELWALGPPSGSSSSSASPESGRTSNMHRRTMEFVPALYKIFDEIMVNAADNLVRDPSMDTIKVNFDVAKSSISVWNNGKGLPLEVHKEHKVHVPELVFGHLLTSDNYDDSEKKVVGGRNGYGAKLTNIYSRRFIIETADSRCKKRYRQVWRNNMTQCEKPEISACKGEDFTCVTFEPDLSRFGMTKLEDDILALMHRRAYDLAASTRGRCKVYLNGTLLKVKSFQDYVALFLTADDFRTHEICNDRWEVAIALTDGSGFQQVSFVNSIATSRGGTHVNYVADQVVSVLLEDLAKHKGVEKSGALSVKAQHVKNHLWVFVNCLIENPAFDSQTKETLTSKKERFGSTCELSEKLLKDVRESGLVDTLLEWSKALGKSELARHLNKSDLGLQKRLFGVPKLEDANKAGTKQSHECTLIVTEGDSAKALAVAGLSVVGRDHYGVFPLRGKLRNVREMSTKQMMENKEIESLIKILALDATKDYQDSKSLRYGSLCIMADQDFDGSHIKGLVINFIHHWFPGLLRAPGFLKEFITPIVKASKGDEEHVFFTVPEYEAWKKANDDGRGWKCKYYKGLGTSTSAEAREYFSDLQNHELTFSNSEQDDDLIDMAFNSKRADDRKEWISQCEDDVYVDHSQETITYSDFVNKELVLFAKYDVERAIPSLVDGLKPGQRKVLYGTFLKKLTNEMKVAQLSGFVAEKSAYHHGEASLQATIIGMAQNFVGSNNINLLMPMGQFGTRNQGGKDHAASRYIFTKLSPLARVVFPEDDDPVLEHQSEEGQTIEPRYFCPVIPMVLVNGAEGIGTGWSTSIPNYNPREIIANVRRYLCGEPLQAMMPWYRGFKGSVVPVAGEKPGRYETLGIAKRRGMTRVEITELPLKKWTQDYKDWLLEQVQQAGGKRSTISEFREYHTDNTVRFSVSMAPDKVAQAEQKGLERALNLRASLSTTNMYLFDEGAHLRKFESPEDILRSFATVRLEVYAKRKKHHMARLAEEVAFLCDRARFIRLVVDGHLEVSNRPTAEVCAEMKRFGLRTKQEIEEGNVQDPPLAAGDVTPSKKRRLRLLSDSEEQKTLAGPTGYGYLLKMKLWTLTEERLAQLERQLEERRTRLEELRATSLEELWERDLVSLEASLDKQEAEEAKELQAAERLAKKSGNFEDDASVNRQCVLVLSNAFSLIKRVRTDQWRASKRGGKGKIMVRQQKKDAATGAEDLEAEAADGGEDGGLDDGPSDAISAAFACREFDALLAFTRRGFVHAMQTLDVPMAKRFAPGASIADLVPDLKSDDQITSVIAVPQGALKDQGDEFAVIVTANGNGKRVPLSSFRGIKPGKSTCAFPLDKGDELRWVHRAAEQDLILLASESGMGLCFPVSKVPKSNSLKVRGKPLMRLKGDMLGSCTVAHLDKSLLDQSVLDAPATTKRPRADSAYQIFSRAQGLYFNQAASAWSALTEADKEVWNAKAKAAKASLDATAALDKDGGQATSSKKARTGGVCDDDDSDNETTAGGGLVARVGSLLGKVRASLGSKAKADLPEDDEAEDADVGDEEEDGDMGEDDKESEDGEAEVEGEVEEAAKPKAAKDASTSPWARATEPWSLMLITSHGAGKRVRLDELNVSSRNKLGNKVIRLEADAKVSSLHVTPNDAVPRAPRKPLSAALLYQDSVNAQQTSEAAPSTDANAEEVFAALSKEKQAPFLEQHGKEEESYKQAMEERKAIEASLSDKLGQVLLCTARGSVKRVYVAMVDVRRRTMGGIKLMQVPSGDELISAALLSSVEAEQDEIVSSQQEQEQVPEIPALAEAEESL
mmetsp:Transcript_29070/g.52693  ORF Transcript_29070/g.52693 Transcript_29070/m.52693 type:complete len:2014 (-) Transcript_29070:71-6112(-)